VGNMEGQLSMPQKMENVDATPLFPLLAKSEA